MKTENSKSFIFQWGSYDGVEWVDDDEQPSEAKESYQKAEEWFVKDHRINEGLLHPERPYRIIEKTTTCHVRMSGKVKGARVKSDKPLRLIGDEVGRMVADRVKGNTKTKAETSLASIITSHNDSNA